jgi:hypothetical protein
MSVNQTVGLRFACAAALPGNTGSAIATGTIATQALGVKCTKLSGKGQWLCVPVTPVNLADGTSFVVTGGGIPSDSNSGVSIVPSDNGDGSFNVAIFDVDGALPSFQAANFVCYTFPKLF